MKVFFLNLNRPQFWLGRICQCCIYILVAVGFIVAVNRMFVSYVNSDHLAMSALYDALFHEHLGMAGWNFSEPPQFFPDMPLFFLSKWLIPDLLYSTALYAIILLIIMACLSHHMFSLYELSSGSKNVWHGLAMLWMVAILCSPESDHFKRLWPNFHGGELVLGLALIIVSAQVIAGRFSLYSSFFINLLLSILAIGSDYLVVAQFILPLGVTFLLTAAVGLVPWRVAIIPVTAFILGHELSRLGIWYLRVYHSFSLVEIGNNYVFSFDIIVQFFKDLVREGPRYFFEYVTIISCLAISMITILKNRCNLKKHRNSVQKGLSLFLAFFFPCQVLFTSLAPVLTDRWSEGGTFRYLSALWYFSPVICTWLIIPFVKKGNGGRLFKAFFIGVIALIAIHNIIKSIRDNDGFGPKLHDMFEDIACVDYIATRHNVKYAYSYYWNAKPITSFSHTGLFVNQLKFDLEEYHWLNHQEWFPKAPFPGSGRSLIFLTYGLRVQSIIDTYGDPDSKYHCGDVGDIFVYNAI